MLPATLAPDIKQQVLHYLGATFNFREPAVERALMEFLNDPENGLFKGPWLQIRRPFRPANEGEGEFFEVPPPFRPFKHQLRSWMRLRTNDEHEPESTLVTTGTGSGKTECFLFPILDDCLRRRRAGVKGIKAIVLYPMNALANDQAGRFARQILEEPRYRDAGIRVGLYVGQSDDNGRRRGEVWSKMDLIRDGNGKVKGARPINDHESLLQQPPDILLTNYKMLDYLLLRPSDKELWRYNAAGVLRYLVLDELHTYDGAQGSDVACLIRRLKERLDIPRGKLCCVGTSATIAGENSVDRLRDFAGKLFEENFPAEGSVIVEDRLSVEEIVIADKDDGTSDLPEASLCDAREDEKTGDYVLRQSVLWGGPSYVPDDDAEERVRREAEFARQLGQWVRERALFRTLLEIASETLVTWDDLLTEIARRDMRFAAPETADRHRLIASFCALIAHARETRSGKDFPLVPTQVQLWVRELRRLGRVVSDKPEFAWLDEARTDRATLPAFHCAECGEAGWIALEDPDRKQQLGDGKVSADGLISDPKAIYQAWFGGPNDSGRQRPQPGIRIITPAPAHAEGQATLDSEQHYLSVDQRMLTLRRGKGNCPVTSAKTFPVRVSAESKRLEKTNRIVGDQRCPHCQSADALFIIGSQGATLASVAIDEIFGSLLNDDPKMLAFTDSVQDASHRAGFFTARTYHFTFRTALQHLIDDAGPGGVPLAEAGSRLLDYAATDAVGRPGNLREAIATLVPPDIREHRDYALFVRDPKAEKPPKKFHQAVIERLGWEAASEFGMQVSIGRTLESNGAACLAWDERVIDATISALRRRLLGIDPKMVQLTDERLRLWIYGMLHHQRERGGLTHSYIERLATKGDWGKYAFRGKERRALPELETHPHRGRRLPRLISTAPDRTHDHVVAASATSRTWQIQWTRRALRLVGSDDTALHDLTRAFLQAGTESSLLRLLHDDSAGKKLYALNSKHAVLTLGGERLVCSATGHVLVRASAEARLWDGAPTLAYNTPEGFYQRQPFGKRADYYQRRYRRGALRRVYASEHTGLLTNEEREILEHRFSRRECADDPNIITCTSTLEMGIDIGDLSTTMLCSVPPTTASYLQRIGRAGRSTGTALIVSIINQKPHDLFFFARPDHMLRGAVEPPGCWLDAAAVLVRQYLAYCFDRAVKENRLKKLPGTARQLHDDLMTETGQMAAMFQWISLEEASLRSTFLGRFTGDIQPDTQARFTTDAAAEVLRQKMDRAVREFETQRRELINAQKRLREQRDTFKLPDDAEQIREIDQELRILKGRLDRANQLTSLELLTDHGLLPNYAFPERGVRFFGAIYNRHRAADGESAFTELEAVRHAGTALRELAPRNHFYTRSRVFEVQSVALGSANDPLLEDWAVCGGCGHMQRKAELERPESLPGCPQCGLADGPATQRDIGQQKSFLEFTRSEAISYMEAYESLSGDKADDRESGFYRLANSFDFTGLADRGAVGDDELPFGIEYRSTVTLRQINGGFWQEPADFPFGHDQVLPRAGFRICRDCGVAAGPNQDTDDVHHRRSCRGLRETERRKQKGQQDVAFKWESVYLYRELRSEALRLLLPDADEADIATLGACLRLGLRLIFEGEPAHLAVLPRSIPDPAAGVVRHFLVLLDAVPGGTGFLKTLYQAKDAQGREGEGVMKILREALVALETCSCRKLTGKAETDGCYRCIRHYQLQYRAELISRERGIRLLGKLIKAGEQRSEKVGLDEISVRSLFGSQLERAFVERLADSVQKGNGIWEETIVRGARGFRFALKRETGARFWELELQPELGPRHGVSIACQPDFLLTCDDPTVPPVAIFTDGFGPHCHPGEAESRLPDDFRKRRAVLASGRYLVWSLTWDDLHTTTPGSLTLKPEIAQMLRGMESQKKANGQPWPDVTLASGHAFDQFLGFLQFPLRDRWVELAQMAVFAPIKLATIPATAWLSDAEHTRCVGEWHANGAFANALPQPDGQWFITAELGLTRDCLFTARRADLEAARSAGIVARGRLGDSPAERSAEGYGQRWRRFLAMLNLLQFIDGFDFWAASERTSEPPEAERPRAEIPAEWQVVRAQAVGSIADIIEQCAAAGLGVPVVEHYVPELGDDLCAELAWPAQRVAVLVGDQSSFAAKWTDAGWRTAMPEEIRERGISWFTALFT